MTEFRQDPPGDFNLPIQLPPPSTNPNRRPLRLLLLGSKQDVIATIKNLHKRGFAEPHEWTKPIPCPNPGEESDSPETLRDRLFNLPADSVISILTKHFSQD
jgi:hypothetical protein